MASDLSRVYTLPAVGEIERDGVHFRSRLDGRYLIMRGVCFGPVAKLEPYLPLYPIDDWHRFEPQIDLLRKAGFTTLRLPFNWLAFEPTCDPERPRDDETYFDSFFTIVERFTSAGFTILLDVHQDLVQPAYGGNGFPTWVKQDGTVDKMIMRNTPLWGLNYVANKHLRRTFTQFWRNDITNTRVDPPLVHFPARDRFLDMIERLAERAARNPHVIGIEVINEPHPAEIKESEFESTLLPEFYRGAVARIRKHSKDLFVFVSPQSDWNVNLRADKNYHSWLGMSEKDDPRLVFAYHYYDSLLTGLHGLHFHEMKREEYIESIALGVREAKNKGMVPFLTEFGSRQNWFRPVTRRHMHWHFEAVEQALVSATYWNVNLYNTEREKDGFMREDFSLLDYNLKPRNLDIVVRPYAIATSAEPSMMHYNDRSHTFELSLLGAPSNSATVLYVPAVRTHNDLPLAYEDGFELYYSGVGGSTCHAQFIPHANQLLIQLDPNAVGHRIAIVGRNHREVISSEEHRVLSYRPPR